TGGHTESLALSDGKVMNASVLADDFAGSGDEFASRVGKRFTSLCEVSIKEALVVAAGNETDFLRVGLFGESESVVTRQFANLGLSHGTERKGGPTELLLGEAEEEVSLILGVVSWAHEQPTTGSIVVKDTCVVSGGETLGTDLAGDDKQLIELEMV